jgi:hypothetical protein
MNKALVDNNYLLERFQAKGGWTYARIPEILQDKKNHFGWVRVKGTINNHAFSGCHLMPMGNGQLFLPVKADIRKKIGKKEGDHVHIILFADNEPIPIPEELLVCLQDEEKAHRIFLSYSEGEKRAFIDWIAAAKKEETKTNRIAKTIDTLLKGLKFADK